MSLSPNARTQLEAKYSLPGETPGDVFSRVARAVGIPECDHVHQIMNDLEFLQNSHAPMNAGLPGGQLAACFVLPMVGILR